MQQLLNSALSKYFGYSNFRNGQDEVIQSVLDGRDILTVMPTGGGKSLCYQLPALLMEGTAIVVSPLIALMKDQVDSLAAKDYPAAMINSTLSYQEMLNRYALVNKGEIKLLYIAPERLESKSFLNFLSGVNISFIAVDEAHCISEWGHDFRPSYLRITEIFSSTKRVPVIALTATATPEVQKDIVKSLKLQDASIYIKGFDRPNLNYRTIEAGNKTDKVFDILRRTNGGSSIIYAASRKRVDMFANEIRSKGIDALRYHAGLIEVERKQEQDKFISRDNSVIVATNAFGMGIDKSNVRNVIHLDYTASMESYYQEAGRAGRDGQPADCTMIYHPQDYFLQEFFIKSGHPEKKDVLKVYGVLFDTMSLSYNKTTSGAIYLSDAELANLSELPFITVQNILRLLEKNRILVRGASKGVGRIKFLQDREFIYEYYELLAENRKPHLEAILRSVSSNSFRELTEFDVNSIISKHSLRLDEFNKSLKQFISAGIFDYRPPKKATGLTLLSERINPDNISIDFEKIDVRRKLAYRKLDIVRRYASTPECKRNYILQYFGEMITDDSCGRCSSCLSLNNSVEIGSKDIFLLDIVIKAVLVLDERFGKIMVSDFIKGKRTKKITDRKLNFLEGYGTGKEIPISEILLSIDNAVANGFLTQTVDMYPVLKVTLKGSQKVKKKTMNNIDTVSDITLNVNDLYNKLEVLREELASHRGILPRGIISDRTLRSIAKVQPKTIEALSNISGVGKLFISEFGRRFIDTLTDVYESEQKTHKKTVNNPKEKLLYRLVKEQITLNRIAEELDLTLAETAKFIQELLEDGIVLEISYLFDERIFIQIQSYLSKYPNAPLKDIKAALNLRTSLPLLRIMIAKARVQTSA